MLCICILVCGMFMCFRSSLSMTCRASPSCVRVFLLLLFFFFLLFFFQAEDGIRDLVRSRGLGDVYKRQATARYSDPHLKPVTHDVKYLSPQLDLVTDIFRRVSIEFANIHFDVFTTYVGSIGRYGGCLLYTSDAAAERSSVDLGGRRIIKNKTKKKKKGGS